MEYTREMFLWQQTYAALFSLSNKLQIIGDKRIGDLTSRQLMVIIAINHLPKDGASLNGIAKKIGTTKQNVKQLITSMEAKGYITVIPSETDKRACNVIINEEKENMLNECFNRGMSFLADLFHEFSIEELENFWSVLKKLYRFDGQEHDGFEETNIEKEGDT